MDPRDGSDQADPYLSTEPREHAPSEGFDFGAAQQSEEMVAGIDALLDQLSRAYDQQARLIRGIGHDFKSPLSSLLHLSESLESGDFGRLTDEQRECVHLISQSARLLTAQAQALYALGESRTGHTVIGCKKMDLTSVLEMISDVSSQRARAKGIGFSIELPPNPIWVSATEGAIERILDNAVGNAIKYTEEGAVQVRVSCAEGSAVVVVRDSGIGIPAMDLSRVGIDYVRAGNVEDYDGTGVGLVVTNHLLAGMGGQMVVESTMGEGTTVTLTFPMSSVQEPCSPDSGGGLWSEPCF